MKRKGFTRLLSCALLLSVLLGALVFPVSAATQFVDVYPGMLSREYFDAINYIVDNGIMNGTDSTHFSPYQNITRGMFVTILYRYSESKERIPSSFSDVPSSTYYYYPIGWATSKGIVNGVTTTTFNPEGVITKEQMAVMLYRYAKNIDGKTYTVSAFDDLTTHPDYSSVSSYAREAVAWAKTYRVFPLRQNSSSYISATANMNRAYAALYIANYAKNITGFPQRDRFSFTNNGDDGHFHSVYVMSSQTVDRLNSCIDQYYGSSTAAATRSKDSIRSDFWGQKSDGSCFGYTFTTLFDKTGKIDFNKNFGKNAATMNSVGRPFNNAATVESAINYYQAIQYISDFPLTYNSYGKYNSSNAANDLYQTFRKYGPTPLGIVWNVNGTEYAHMILVTNVTKRGAILFDIAYIDPDDLNGYTPSTETLIATTDAATFLGAPVEQLGVFTPTSTNWFDNFDLDGDYNNSHYIPINSSVAEISNSTEYMSDSATPATSLPALAETATLIVSGTKFQLTNASGEVLSFDGQDFSGSMSVFSNRVIFSGLSIPCSMVIEIPKSDYYEYVNLSDGYASFSIVSNNALGKVSGTGIHSVMFDAAKSSISVDGKDIDFSLCLRTNIQQFEYFYLNGQNNLPFMIGVDDSAITTAGLSGTMECGYAPPTSFIPETTSLSLTENCSIDFAEAANGYLNIITSGDTVSNFTLPITSFVKDELYE